MAAVWTPVGPPPRPGSIWDGAASIWDGGSTPYDAAGALWDAHATIWTGQSAPPTTWTMETVS